MGKGFFAWNFRSLHLIVKVLTTEAPVQLAPTLVSDPLSLRKIIHDLNGEIFLIRGYSDLSLQLTENPILRRNLERMLERCDHLEAIIRRLREAQKRLES